ncbi:MAG: cysteine desulfurase [Alphaproteobacteria bacterium]
MTALHKSGFPINDIRSDFPILSEKIYGKPLVYLDNGASAQKPIQVIKAISGVYEARYANVHRGVHYLSQVATDDMEAAREKVRGFINARSEREVIFVRGATEGINLVASSWGRANLTVGDEIILSQMEHHSNIVPWQLIADITGAIIKVIPINDAGELEIEVFQNLLSETTKMVAITHVSNALGTIVPLEQVIKKSHDAGALVLVDGCQAAPHLQVDVQELDADFYVFSGHKIYGPSGIGVLYGKESLLESMPPYQGGGEMIDTVSFSGSTWADLPFKFEAGTPNIADAIGIGNAIDYVSALGLTSIMEHEEALLSYATEKLKAINSIRIIGNASKKAAIISFVMGDIHPHDIGTILDRQGVAVRTGHHCAQPVMERYDISATVRASFALYNTFEEIDSLASSLSKVKEIFG